MIFFLLFWLILASQAEAINFPNLRGDWNLIWQDEFSSTTVDTAKWTIEGNWSIDSKNNFWVNQNNTAISDGNLVLRVGCELSDPPRCDGGGVHSRGNFEHRFGYYEARIKFSNGIGQNPAFWMHSWNMPHINLSGKDGAEIDIIEKPWATTQYQQTIHWDGYSLTHPSIHKVNTSPDISDGQFHIISFLWEPNSYRFFIDGVETWSISDQNIISQVPEFLWFTNAPSEWGGVFTRQPEIGKMYVDYVRVYEPSDKPIYDRFQSGISFQYKYLNMPETYVDVAGGIDPIGSGKLNDNIVPSVNVADTGWVGIKGPVDGKVKINIANDMRVLESATLEKMSFDLLRNETAGIKIPTKISIICLDQNTLITEIIPSLTVDNQVNHIDSPFFSDKCSNIQLTFDNWFWTFIGEIELTGILNEIPPSTPILVVGDASGDGKVDLVDFSIWKDEYIAKIKDKADFNGDGKVDLADISIWKDGYLTSRR